MADSPLQKAPLGLLGAFALKVLGVNPDFFGRTVVPIADVYDQYLATTELQIKQGSAVAAIGSGSEFPATFTVPAGKVWRVIGGSISGSLNVADAAINVQGTFGVISPNSGPTAAVLATGPIMTGMQAGTRSFGCSFRPPIFLPSGWSISSGVLFSAVTTVVSTWLATALIQEFDL